MLGKPCKVMVTGATGFVGAHLLKSLIALERFDAVPCVRRNMSGALGMDNAVLVGDINGTTDWKEALSNVDVVVHVAARAHVGKEPVADPLILYRQVNVEGTLNLARHAAKAGVQRFIFISSIGVNGNANTRPFTVNDGPDPRDPYAKSKWEAEQGLWEVQQKTGMEIVIIRPPLVYGPGAPGNFGRLVTWVERGIPLPLGAIHNRRTLVGIDNLVDLILHCTCHPAAANQVFLAGDAEDLSTTALLRQVAIAKGRSARLIPVPARLLELLLILLGKRAMAQRLLGSLQVDITRTCELLDWKPPYTVKEGLARCFIDSL
ncbi:SDR family oxidoreductase [Pseudomonas putida]|uniref:UDP-glucose 4-epimerase family protein n=1 Tax=Pseudomonas putida TaxID=303 RepID=UPI0018A904B9|nr:SDR family oxidoreductase [Pseudomonas putida]MBF8669040.1 SDR family oxidoreductase [Pseudomonas putida]MBF8711009.1 SDR family oxidoreductase [Pseudomonas putida]